MHKQISGLHHVSAITSNTQKNLEFYAGILGLKPVKKTVDFEDAGVYHLYFGNETGEPGSILTFLSYEGLKTGRHGYGMVNTTSLSADISSLDFWMERLERFQVPFKHPQERFDGEVFIYFEDMDGLGLEIVFGKTDLRKGYENGIIPAGYAIKGLHHVEIWEKGYGKMESILTQQLQHELIAEKGNRFRFATEDHPGNYVDILLSPHNFRGFKGSGTVHHVALSTPDMHTLFDIHEKLYQHQFNPSFIRDQTYFKSLFFETSIGAFYLK